MFRRSVTFLGAVVAFPGITQLEVSNRYSPDWEMYFVGPGKRKVSPWHDIPLIEPIKAYLGLRPDSIFNYFNEIPKGTTEKLELKPDLEHNPIRQDVFKDGKLRSFTYGKITFNYGCFPRTFEDPRVKDDNTQCYGDGDPLDVVELSPSPIPVGVIRPVRVLGALGLIDQGEMDWKIIAIDYYSPITKIQQVPPEVINDLRAWFRYYKTTDGKPVNSFAYKGAVITLDSTIQLIKEASEQYKNLISGKAANSKGLWIPPS